MPTSLHPRFEGTLLHIQHADDGRLWFHGGEITRLLDYPDGAAAIHQHCRLAGLSFGEAEQPEPRMDLENVYRLIVASPSPRANAFATWLTHRFLPPLCSAQAQPKPSRLYVFGRRLQVIDWQDTWWMAMRDVVEVFERRP